MKYNREHDNPCDQELLERRSERIIPFVKEGKIIELGCGYGATLSVLSKHFPHSVIVGLDINEDDLKKINERNLGNIIPIKGDILQEVFLESTFDTAIFKFALHEVYSSHGNDGIEKALSNAYKILKDGGILIIYEHLRPHSKEVGIRIKEDIYRIRFKKFSEEFLPRRIRYRIEGEWIRLDIADCLEFLTKYHALDWKDEMKETHFFYTLEEFQQSLLNAKFNIKKMKKYRFEQDVWKKKMLTFDVDFKNPKCYIMIISRKS
jgi:SAM-dependent methyltransferase